MLAHDVNPKENQMSQTVKAATRIPADRKLLAMMKKEIRGHFEGLKGARIFVVLVADKRDDWLGKISKTSESDWLATADQDGVGTDLILELNGTLWEAAGEESRRGQLGNLLSRAHAKETGKTLQEHPRGNRQLYGVRNPTCGLAGTPTPWHNGGSSVSPPGRTHHSYRRLKPD